MIELFTSDIIAGIAAIAAIGALIYSRNAIRVAKEANEIAKGSYDLSKKQYDNQFPHFNMEMFEFIPENFKAFSNDKQMGEEYITLHNHELLEHIKNHKHKITFLKYDEKEYLLINILEKNDPLDQVYLYLGIADLKFINRYRDARKFEIIKSRSTLINGTPICLDNNILPFQIGREGSYQNISISLAYALARDKLRAL